MSNNEKKRMSGGTESIRQDTNQDALDGDDATQGEVEEEEEDQGRTLFFNLPLPDDLKDEDGNLTQHYPRNKIRTAKYTPLSFIPKNLWFQFHNIANIFFLFTNILAVSLSSVAPLAISPCCVQIPSPTPYPLSNI
jgi:phospholipid-translocating ATPase